MHEDSNPDVPRFNLKTVLAWIGGFALLIWGWQLVTSVEFWNIVTWPGVMIVEYTGLSPTIVLIVYATLALVVTGIIAWFWPRQKTESH